MRTIIVSLLAASTMIATAEASFGRDLRAQKGPQHFAPHMSKKAQHDKEERQRMKDEKLKAHLKEEMEKNSERPEQKGAEDYTHPQKAHLLHSKEQEKYDAPVQEYALTPEQYEAQHK